MFVKEVKEYAYDNYDKEGWDYIVECYSDKEISALIKGAKSKEEAIKMAGEEVGIRADYREDIQGLGW